MVFGVGGEVGFYVGVVVADALQGVAEVVDDAVVEGLLVVGEVFLHRGTEEAPVGCVVAVAGVAYAGEVAGEDLFLEGVHGVGDAFEVVEDGYIVGN